MTQDEIIKMIGLAFGRWPVDMNLNDIKAFAKLVADKKEAEMQDRIDTLHAMYEQACKQRDESMDAQRSMVAAMRGRMQ